MFHAWEHEAGWHTTRMASSQPDPGVAIFAHIPLKHSVEEEKQIALAFGKQRDPMQRDGFAAAECVQCVPLRRALTTFIFFFPDIVSSGWSFKGGETAGVCCGTSEGESSGQPLGKVNTIKAWAA